MSENETITIQPTIQYQILKNETGKPEFEYCPYTDNLINNCCVSQLNKTSQEYLNIDTNNLRNEWFDDFSCLCCFVPCILSETISLPFRFCYYKTLFLKKS